MLEWTDMLVGVGQWWLDEPPVFVEILRAVILLVLAWLSPLIVSCLVVYLLFSLPLRRRERARLFLDLMELGLKQGRSPEQTIMGVASCEDRSPGVRFQMLAAHLERGSRLGEALDNVPRLLPPQIAAILRVGENVGDMRKVLPACRAILRDGLNRASSALNSMPLLLYFTTGAPLVILWMLQVFILPKFQDLAKDFNVEIPAITRWVFGGSWVLLVVGGVMFCVVVGPMLLYWAGPRLHHWFRTMLGPVMDGMVYRIPWRRHRLHRDFAAVLAQLLDGGVPEPQAILMAAEATANGVMMKRAGHVRAELERGVDLPEAMRFMDDQGQFRWRLANAAQGHGSGRFAHALAGWGEALDARAFQQEQTAVQILTTQFVLINGLIVGLITVGVFAMLVSWIESMVLW